MEFKSNLSAARMRDNRSDEHLTTIETITKFY